MPFGNRLTWNLGNTAKKTVTDMMPGSSLFVDGQQLKDSIRTAMLKQQYQVEDLYWEHGWMQSIARHHLLEKATLSVVVLNAIWIAVDTDNNKSSSLYDSKPVFIVAENVFCVYFSVELLIRFVAFRRKLDCFMDRWFVFDLFLVVF